MALFALARAEAWYSFKEATVVRTLLFVAAFFFGIVWTCTIFWLPDEMKSGSLSLVFETLFVRTGGGYAEREASRGETLPYDLLFAVDDSLSQPSNGVPLKGCDPGVAPRAFDAGRGASCRTVHLAKTAAEIAVLRFSDKKCPDFGKSREKVLQALDELRPNAVLTDLVGVIERIAECTKYRKLPLLVVLITDGLHDPTDPDRPGDKFLDFEEQGLKENLEKLRERVTIVVLVRTADAETEFFTVLTRSFHGVYHVLLDELLTDWSLGFPGPISKSSVPLDFVFAPKASRSERRSVPPLAPARDVPDQLARVSLVHDDPDARLHIIRPTVKSRLLGGHSKASSVVMPLIELQLSQFEWDASTGVQPGGSLRIQAGSGHDEYQLERRDPMPQWAAVVTVASMLSGTALAVTALRLALAAASA